MHLHVILKTSAYRYLWAKHVRGFDSSHHCAKCLIGPYDDIFGYRSPKTAGVVFEAPIVMQPDERYLYVCGVTPRYPENLHLALIPALGSRVECEDQHVEIVADGFARLPIPSLDEVAGLPAGITDKPKAFTTCRNYQFGAAYFRGQ